MKSSFLPKKLNAFMPYYDKAKLLTESSEIKPQDTYTANKEEITIPLIRPIAEYEEMGGVLIAYPGSRNRQEEHIQLPPNGPRAFGIPDELILRILQQGKTAGEKNKDKNKELHIFILCADATQKGYIILSLQKSLQNLSGIDLDLIYMEEHIHLVDWDTDTYWTRDFGPWWTYNSDTKCYGIAKHLYTSLGGGSVGLIEGAEYVDPHDKNKDRQGHGIFRPNDDYAADKFSDFLNSPIRTFNRNNKEGKITPHDWYNTGLLHVGGNYMSTSKGVTASSYLVATQNELPDNTIVPEDPKTKEPAPSADEISKRMQYITDQLYRFMGINTNHVFKDPTGTYIGHIDCWGKFLSDNTVLIATVDDQDTNDKLNAIADYFQNPKEGEKLKVVRVLCQDIIVPPSIDPVTGIASPKQDTTAAYTNSLLLNGHAYIPVAEGDYKTDNKNALDKYIASGFTAHAIPNKPGHPWLGTDALHCRTRAIPRDVINNWLKAIKENKGE